MTLAEFITTIRGWTGYKDPTVHDDALITSWIRMGEERLNDDLRIDRMVIIDATGTVASNTMDLPADWLESDFVRFVDGPELVFATRPNFYDKENSTGFYTVSGRTLIFGGTESVNEGKEVELHYFQEVPQFTGPATWVSDHHIRLLTSATMVPASMHLQEPERVQMWEAGTQATIDKLNSNYKTSKVARGGTLVRNNTPRF